MDDQSLRVPVGDPVADVLLAFQSVMAEFLEVEAGVLGTLASVRPADGAPQPSPLPAPVRSAAAPTDEQVPANVSAAAAVEAIREPAASAVTSSPAVEAEGAAEDGGGQSSFSRYSLTIRERPAAAARGALAPGHAVLITDEGRGLAGRVAARLRNDGLRVAVVSPAAGAEPDLFISPLDSVEEAERVVRLIESSCGPLAALIHLAPLSAADAFDELDTAAWWSRISSETRGLFVLSRVAAPSLARAAASGGAVMLAATAMGGSFGIRADGRAFLPTQGGVAGFVKCAAIEWQDVRVRAVDLDGTEPLDAWADHVVAEFWSTDRAVEVGYPGGLRSAIEVERAPGCLDRSFAVPSDAIILATGGARGITAEVCLELAERYQPTFVIVGQSPQPPLTESGETAALETPRDLKRALTARLQASGGRVTPAQVEKACRQLLKEREIRETIGRLGAAGARTHYVQANVHDEQAFGALIDEIYATYGRIDGVIHGAGIIEDKLIADKSLESFDRVLRTKAISAFVLSRRIRPESLRFAVFFSSVAGRFGNRGQADYAASNEIVSKLAVLLQRRWPGRVCAIAWAPWDKRGMVSPELKREFARRGVELLPPAAGRRALWEEIQQMPAAHAEVVIGGTAPASLADAKPDREPLPLLKHATRAADGGTVRFVRQLDPSVDLYLNDHRLDGRPVLPLAFATEIMAQAAQSAHPELRVVAVRDLQLLKGIVIDDGPVAIVVSVGQAVQRPEPGTFEAAVDLSTPASAPRTRYRATVQLTSAAVVPETPAFEVPAWRLMPLSRSLDRAYRDWTFHGPLFQRVTGVMGIGDGAMVAGVYSSSAIPVIAGVERPEWLIDPFVFDGALQLLLMWSRARNDKTALPSRFRSFARHAALSDEPLTCYVAVESLAAGHALKSTVHFVDAAGRVRAVLDSMEASCTSALNRLAAAEARHEGAR